MCICLFTTAHPDYALILIDNRDEYILRPTSRPHWWTNPATGHEVLSSRDLQRAEKGTWLGISKDGYLAVLTNYRETDTHDVQHPVHGVRSRGKMVTAWLGGLPKESVKHGVDQLVRNGGVQGVGGFSMVCGKLRRNNEGLAIVSNRAGHANDVPVVGQERGAVWGLSNTVYDEKEEWPKVRLGKQLLTEVVDKVIDGVESQDELVARLFGVLDTDTLPRLQEGANLTEYIQQLKHSIYVPALGDAAHREAMAAAAAKGRGLWPSTSAAEQAAAEQLVGELRPEPDGASAMGFETGMYGTQRQTVLLVDWQGEVTFVERALWDANGNEVKRGEGDVTFRFKVDGWDE